MLIGKDEDGITNISLNVLKDLFYKKLKKVYIHSENLKTICKFEFENNEIYEASGFAIGYGGEGPHGLHKAIRFWDKSLHEDFWQTSIHKLDTNHDWEYIPNKGFFSIINFEETF